MQTIIVQLTHQSAMKLLKDLEELRVIKLLVRDASAEPLADRFAGKLSSELAEQLQRYIRQSRDEWNSTSS
jgi:hypothetical protein